MKKCKNKIKQKEEKQRNFGDKRTARSTTIALYACSVKLPIEAMRRKVAKSARNMCCYHIISPPHLLHTASPSFFCLAQSRQALIAVQPLHRLLRHHIDRPTAMSWQHQLCIAAPPPSDKHAIAVIQQPDLLMMTMMRKHSIVFCDSLAPAWCCLNNTGDSDNFASDGCKTRRRDVVVRAAATRTKLLKWLFKPYRATVH